MKLLKQSSSCQPKFHVRDNKVLTYFRRRPILLLYYQYKPSTLQKVLLHTLSSHDKNEQFSARKIILDEQSGKSAFRSIHYNVSVKDINQHIEQGTTPLHQCLMVKTKYFFRREESGVSPKIQET